jgi:hypothetical protein
MANQFVERILNGLFGSRSESLSEELAPIKEKLVRHEKFAKEFDNWKSSTRPSQLLYSLSELYEEALMGSANSLLNLHQTPQANGFFFDDRSGVNTDEFSFLLDHFRDQTLSEGYTVYTSDKKYEEKSDSVKVTEKHYLKPTLDRSMEIPIDQRYGNILLEYVSFNGNPAYLKVLATCYSDRNYSKPLEFELLVKKLFDVPNLDR